MNVISNLKKFISNMAICLSLTDRKIKTLMVLCGITGALTAVIELVFVQYLQNFFKNIELLNSSVNIYYPINSLSLSIGVLITVALFRAINDGFKIYIARLIQQQFSNLLRKKIIDTTMNGSFDISSGKALSLFTDEAQRAGVSALNLASFFTQIFSASFIFVIAISISWQQLLIGTALLILLYLPVQLLNRFLSGSGSKLSQEWEKTNNSLTEAIRNKFYLKVYGLLPEMEKKTSQSLNRYLKVYKNAFKLISIKAATPSFLGLLIIASISYVNFLYGNPSNNNNTIDFFYLFLRFTQALAVAATLTSDFAINSQSSLNIASWLKLNKIKSIKNEQIYNSEVRKETFNISLKNISFSYDNKNIILNNLNSDINQNDCLVITGKSGSGKSTLLSLILGLNEPTSGEVKYNNNSFKSQRNQIISNLAYVGAFPFLIEGTILENLTYGLNEKISPNEEQVNKVLKISCIDKFVNTLPEGFHSHINEIGSTISTGQKQRLMLARALLREPSIFVMDEFTSNLDEAIEKEIINNLRPILKEKVTIIVTHRPQLLELATKTIEL